MVLHAPLAFEGIGVAVPGALLNRVGAGVAGGIRVRRVVDRDAADNIFPLLGHSAGKEKAGAGVRTERRL